MLVTCQQMSEAEARLFSGNISPEPYMDAAGLRCAHAIQSFFPDPGHAEVFCGKGNNGGDALVVARWLKRSGWSVRFHFSHGLQGISELAKRKWVEWNAEPEPARVERRGPTILVDGLLGIGATGDLRGAIRECTDNLNLMRDEQHATTFAIDIPTGLDADTGEAGAGAVVADYTLSITAAKTGFAADTSTNHLGRLVEIPLPIPLVEADRSTRFLFPSHLRARLPRRDFDFHKGSAGRVLLIAGSRGMTGAGVLSTLGASHTGAGLTTLCVPEEIYPVLAATVSAEIMVRPVASLKEALDMPHDVIGIGPGLGNTWEDELTEVLFSHPKPIVVDADALNQLSRCERDLENLPSARLLTPHPGELSRLTSLTGPRVEITRSLAERWGVTLLHKGSRTVVATPGEKTEINTTGHPGMASGGMGDVLTGICAALIGQGLSLHDSAALGSWLLGKAAEIARDQNDIAARSVTAPLAAHHLGHALADLQQWSLPEAQVPTSSTVSSEDSEEP
ncbi:MAG: NAD(P)H-hydrate dehydratase [Verrucomicrobiales bacterium]|jgi:NAD(P)H-hydrate epimerase|nr:NAD(P)H-hydrate dehydratase [Verrucomicrobiales bacterium]